MDLDLVRKKTEWELKISLENTHILFAWQNYLDLPNNQNYYRTGTSDFSEVYKFQNIQAWFLTPISKSQIAYGTIIETKRTNSWFGHLKMITNTPAHLLLNNQFAKSSANGAQWPLSLQSWGRTSRDQGTRVEDEHPGLWATQTWTQPFWCACLAYSLTWLFTEWEWHSKSFIKALYSKSFFGCLSWLKFCRQLEFLHSETTPNTLLKNNVTKR